MSTTTPLKLFPAVLAGVALLLLAPTVAAAAEAPVKEVLSSHIGAEANKNGSSICSVALKEECQPGKQTGETDGFDVVDAVAVNDDPGSLQYHDLYVVDEGTHRVDVLNADGQFVSSFGTQGSAPGQFENFPLDGIAVDQTNGNVYVSDSLQVGATFSGRVQEFTAEGHFLLDVGSEAFSQGGKLAFGGPEELLYVGEGERIREFEADGKFKREISLKPIVPGLESNEVTALAINPSGDIYFVYKERSVQSEVAKGYEGESITETLRINSIYGLDPQGDVIGEFKLSPRRPEVNSESGLPNSFVEVAGLAVDPAGRLAVTEYETGNGPQFSANRGALYGIVASHLHLITEFTDPGGVVTGASNPAVNGPSLGNLHALAFNDNDELYAADFYGTSETTLAVELIHYTPVPVAEPLTGTAGCTPGGESETDVTVDCALHGEINPWEVTGTDAWFQWGATTELGQETPKQTICTTSCAKTPITLGAATVKGLLPNETYYYETVGEDANVKAPELLVSETTSFKTGLVPPQVVGAPSASFVKSFSAVMSGELNPENANTRFAFQYAPTQACVAAERVAEHPVVVGECPGMLETGALHSSEYARVATTLEARGLQPSSGYRYRLVAKSENNAKSETREGAGPEGEFQTAPAPIPSASSAAASAVGATSATVEGVVNPGGQPAVYTFELGVYDAAGTQYGIVLSAPAGSGTVPVEEALALTGLQPGTTYAYRIAVSSSYGTSYGETMTFTTTGLPAVLVEPTVLPQVPVPAIAFPTETRGATKTKSAPKKCATGKKLNHDGKCVGSKHKSRKQAKHAKKAKKSSTSKERQ